MGKSIVDAGLSTDANLQGYWTLDQTEDTNTKLLLHFNGADAAVSTIESSTGKAVTFVATAQIDTAQKKFGSSALLLDGNSDYVTLADSADWSFGSNNWTIDFWWRATDAATGNGGWCSQVTDNSNFFLFGYGLVGASTVYFKIRTGGTDTVTISGNGGFTNNTWHHIALIHNSTTYTIYVDGTSVGSVTDADNMGNYTGAFQVGRGQNESPTQYYTNGWIDEFRLVNGTAKWTANFTPPTTPYSFQTDDLSPNGYHVATGTRPTNVTGLFGQAGDFEASSSQYTTIADASCPSLELTGSRTISSWFKPESFAGISAIAGKRGTDYSTAPGYLFYVDTDAKVHMTVDGLTTNTDAVSTSVLGTGNWYHLAGIYNGTNLRVFINGAVSGSSNATGTGASNNGWGFCIGADNQGASNAFALFADGIIDDVAIFNRALSNAEISSIYAAEYSVAISDSINLTDTLYRTSGFIRSNSDTLNITDTLVKASEVILSISDNIVVITDTVLTTTVNIIEITQDMMGIIDSNDRLVSYTREPLDNIYITETIDRTQVNYSELSDNIGLTDYLIAGIILNVSLSDDIGITDFISASFITNAVLSPVIEFYQVDTIVPEIGSIDEITPSIYNIIDG